MKSKLKRPDHDYSSIIENSIRQFITLIFKLKLFTTLIEKNMENSD